MNMAYRAFARVEVRHDYFADGSARHLRFVPHAATAVFLRRFDMPCRSDDRSLLIGVEEAMLAGIWSERQDDDQPRELRFDIHWNDPACAYYTDAVIAPREACNDDVPHVPLREPVVAFPTPLVTIGLPLLDDAQIDFETWRARPEARYRLDLSSRHTIWKYVFVGDWRGRSLAVVDVRDEVAFTAPVGETLPDGQAALVVHSASPIALRERPPQRFQLRDVTESPERVLISRLPGAQPQRLWREMLGGQPTIVSEIFVHS